MYYLSKSHDLAVAQIPKAGLQTIREWLGKSFTVVSNEEALSVSTRVAFIRHPIERLVSAYSFFYWLKDYGTSGRDNLPTSSWEEFVDYTLVNLDEHWNPQVDHIGESATVIHKFEDIEDHWEKYRKGILPHNNRSTRLHTTEYRMEDLLHKYKEDLLLWRSAE